MRPIFPDNVGVWVPDDGRFSVNFAVKFPVPAREHDVAGYWIIPICVILGMLFLRATHALARRFLARWKARRALAQTARFVG